MVLMSSRSLSSPSATIFCGVSAAANKAGVAFWERHGYRYAGVLRGYYQGRVDAYWMLKSLEEKPK